MRIFDDLPFLTVMNSEALDRISDGRCFIAPYEYYIDGSRISFSPSKKLWNPSSIVSIGVGGIFLVDELGTIYLFCGKKSYYGARYDFMQRYFASGLPMSEFIILEKL